MEEADLKLVPRTDPVEIYRWRDGFYAVDYLTVAVAWLDIFTRLAAKPSDLRAVCRSLEVHERPADVLLTLLTAMGLLSKEGGVYRVTDLAREHLVKGSPWNLGPYYEAFKERPVAKDLLAVLRTGKPAGWGSFQDQTEWAKAMEDDRFAAQFTAVMDCRGAYLGPALARKVDLKGHRRLLDVAGGSGIYACALAAHHPGLAATVLEKPPVDRVARKCIAERGFAERVTVAAGDMFRDPLPEGHDLHLFSNVLHDWDVPLVEKLIQSSFRSLAPGGMILIHDAHLNADKTGPLPVAQYSVILMHSTQGRCYSTAETEGYLRAAGFVEFRHLPTAADRSVITARKPTA